MKPYHHPFTVSAPPLRWVSPWDNLQPSLRKNSSIQIYCIQCFYHIAKNAPWNIVFDMYISNMHVHFQVRLYLSISWYYQGKPMVNKPLIRPYFWGGGSFGGVARIPMILWFDMLQDHFKESLNPIANLQRVIVKTNSNRESHLSIKPHGCNIDSI